MRNDMGLTNVEIMVPFVRTAEAGASASPRCWPSAASSAGRTGLKLIMMCEVPSNAILAEEFLEHFDGFSIGSQRPDAAHPGPGPRLRAASSWPATSTSAIRR